MCTLGERERARARARARAAYRTYRDMPVSRSQEKARPPHRDRFWKHLSSTYYRESERERERDENRERERY